MRFCHLHSHDFNGFHANEIGYYMHRALEMAEKASRAGEIPIASIWLGPHRRMIGSTNQITQDKNPLAHAEMICIRKAAKVLHNERIGGILISTLEPCLMCLGAICLARIEYVFFAAEDPKQGACRLGQRNLPLNHFPKIFGGIMENESARLLRNFFRQRRNKGRNGL